MSLFHRNTCNRGSPTLRCLTILAVFVAAFSHAASAHAATYYVATTGSDSNPGSQGAPFKNIQKAVGVVRAGDTVIVTPGRYRAFETKYINGAPGAPITFKGEPGAIIDRNLGGGDGLRNISIFGGSYLTFDGLELTDSDTGSPPTSCIDWDHGSGRNGIKLNQGTSSAYPHHVIFTNLHIHDLRATAILGSGQYIQFTHNNVHNNGGKGKGWPILPESYGTYIKGRFNVISGNTIHDQTGNGIRTGNDPSTSPTELLVDSIIENNVVYNNGGTWSHPAGSYGTPEFKCVPATGGDGIVLWHGSGNIIRNNIVYGNVGYGIRVNEDKTMSSTPNAVYNNTVYKSGSVGIYSYADEGTLVKNNISYLNTGQPIFGGVTSNNLTTDPQFVNPGAGDFGLQAGSPAIDKGVTLAQVPTDFTGKARPEGAAYDIGAFEGAGSKKDVLPGVGAVLPGATGRVGAGGSSGSGSGFGGLSNCAR